jgi:hypothetical protein
VEDERRPHSVSKAGQIADDRVSDEPPPKARQLVAALEVAPAPASRGGSAPIPRAVPTASIPPAVPGALLGSGAAAAATAAPQGDSHRAGPNRATRPSVLAENPYQRPALGPRFGPNLCDFRSPDIELLRARLVQWCF